MAKKKKDILDDEEYEEEYDEEYEDEYDDEYDDDDLWEEDDRNRRKLIIAIAAVLAAIVLMLILIFFPGRKSKKADDAAVTAAPDASAEVVKTPDATASASASPTASASASAEPTAKATAAPSVGTVSNVRISSNSAYMTVSWDAAPGATGYIVGVNSNGAFSTYDTTGTSVQVPTSAISDGNVAVTIIARDSAGNEGNQYNTSYAYRFEQDPLATPTGFSSYQDGSSIVITWNAVPNAAYYSIITGYGADTVWEPKYVLDMSAADSANFSITVYAYPPEDDFRYKSSEPASYSLSYSAPQIDTPTGVSAVMGGADLTVTWNDVNGETGYTVTVTGPDGATVSSVQASEDGTSATFYGIGSKLTSGATYTISVIANGGGGMSTSAAATATFTYQ